MSISVQVPSQPENATPSLHDAISDLGYTLVEKYLKERATKKLAQVTAHLDNLDHHAIVLETTNYLKQ